MGFGRTHLPVTQVRYGCPHDCQGARDDMVAPVPTPPRHSLVLDRITRRGGGFQGGAYAIT